MSSDHFMELRPTGGVSRRQFMIFSAAVAGVPLVAAVPPGVAFSAGAAEPGEEEQAYQQAVEAALASDPRVRRHLEPGREFGYRPRQILAANADAQRVAAKLREYGLPAQLGNRFAGVTKLVFATEVDVPSIIRRLRDPKQWPTSPVPAVQPHHLTMGFGNIMGNPGTPPRVAAPLPAPDPTRLGEGAGVTVGICDTGIWRDAGALHPLWLGGSYVPETDDEDPVYVHSDQLAVQGGHGTFVAGVVRQAAPGVRFDPEQALNRFGVGDEEMLVNALGRLGQAVTVVNLSLGCFTQDDLPSLPIANAVAALPDRVVVVAAAGNAGTSRPTWPAALADVLSVGAVRLAGTGIEPDPQSSFGPWVAACAFGDRVSTYVPGQLALTGLPVRVFHGFAGWSGTSFATAHVSGRLAAMMTAGNLDAEQARLALLATPRWHPDYGVLVG
ncbi:S8/S53 family peptidase [Micromonospora sonneratiae]|uniref:S8 family serine peptidase n=1 Tax=Micromonospora sonneratiae TaxID=1184706 RepID=A0ABW3YKA3_9ACTN